MRENIKNLSLILALILAGVSLPTSIISFSNKPGIPITEINNYHYNNTVVETFNNTTIERYNNTIIVIVNNTVVVNETIVEENPIPDRSKSIEEHYFTISTSHPLHIIGNYTMSPNENYFLDSVRMVGRAQELPNFFVIEDSWFNLWNETDGEIGEFFYVGDGHPSNWTPPYLSNWVIIATVDDAYIPNNWDYTVYDSITTIGL